MTSIEDIKDQLLRRLCKQGWVEAYGPNVSEGRALVAQLLHYVFGGDAVDWDDPDAMVIPKTADLRRIAALRKYMQKLQSSLNETKHVLDPVDRTLNSETRPVESRPLSTRLKPLLDDLASASEVALHPLRRKRRGAPRKKAQEGLIEVIASQVQRILTRCRYAEGKPPVNEIASVVAEVVSLVNVRVQPKTVQNLLKHPD